MTDTPMRENVIAPYVERHDGDEPAICVGQWCCGCAEHPIGKPWGWNWQAWERHRVDKHESRFHGVGQAR